MIQTIALGKRISRILAPLTLVMCSRSALIGQNQGATDTPNTGTAALRVTHILGFEGISSNAAGDLFIQGDALRFRKTQGVQAQIATGLIQNVTVGEQDRQVGGVPMTLARSATPYGGGRVVALFSHKKFATVTLEYRDLNGGFHGAIFQLNKGEGKVLVSELEAKGVQVNLPVLGVSNQNIQESKNEVK